MKNKKRKGRRAQGQKEQTAKVDSASETTPQYDAIQLKRVVQPMIAEEAPPF